KAVLCARDQVAVQRIAQVVQYEVDARPVGARPLVAIGGGHVQLRTDVVDVRLDTHPPPVVSGHLLHTQQLTRTRHTAVDDDASPPPVDEDAVPPPAPASLLEQLRRALGLEVILGDRRVDTGELGTARRYPDVCHCLLPLEELS